MDRCDPRAMVLYVHPHDETSGSRIYTTAATLDTENHRTRLCMTLKERMHLKYTFHFDFVTQWENKRQSLGLEYGQYGKVQRE